MTAHTDRNLLVISDLHLGEDLRPHLTDMSQVGHVPDTAATPGQAEATLRTKGLRRIAKLERELESFLDHYTNERVDERSWRLVVAGDMVDFMSVMVLPNAATSATDNFPAEDREFGLGYGEQQTLQKLGHVVRRHRGVFGRLASFLAAGNELVVVVGNHDVEFQFPAVQRGLVDALRELGAGEAAEQVQFCPWFYYEKELIYVEHGHQYDEYCSFDYQLHPVESKTGGIAMSVAHAGIRYFSNLVPSIDPGQAEIWGFFDYIRWAIAQGAKGMGRMAFLYGLMVWKLVAVWSSITDRASDEVRRGRHAAALSALALEYQLAEEKVAELDGLRSVPVVRRLFKILRAFFFDRIAIGVFTVLVIGMLQLVTSGAWRLGSSVGVLLAAIGLDQWLGRDRMLPSEDALRRAPAAIRRILSAPFIVFGHSHAPEAVQLDGGAVYFNVGTWIADNVHGAFTHLIVSRGATSEGGPRAELRQWRDGVSEPFQRVMHPAPVR